MPPATLQVSDPTLTPERPFACGVPGVAGVWALAETTAPTSNVAALAAAKNDRTMEDLPQYSSACTSMAPMTT
jgi:hypothetical protein